MKRAELRGLLLFLLVSSLCLYALAACTNTQNVSGDGCSPFSASSIETRRALGLILRDRQVLVVKLASEKNYSPPGGHIDRGETPEMALRRELNEELGADINVSAFTLYKKWCDVNDRGENQQTSFYQVEAPDLVPALANPKDKVRWVDSQYADNKKADSELVKALEYLSSGDLID